MCRRVCQRTAAIDGSGRADFRRNVLQADEQDHKRLADLKQRHDHEDELGRIGVGQPIGRRQAEAAQDQIQRAVERIEDPQRDQRVSHIGNDRGQIDRSAIQVRCRAAVD